MHTSGTGGLETFFGVFQQFCFSMHISFGLRGGNRVTGGSLLTVAALIVCIQAARKGGKFGLACFNHFFFHVHISRAAGGGAGTGGSILTVAALNVCIQAAQEGGKPFLACFNNLFFHVHFSRAAGGEPGYGRRLLYAYKRHGRAANLFWRVSTIFFPCTYLPGCGGGRVPAALYSRLRRLMYAYKRHKRAGNRFWRVSTIYFSMYISPGLRGGNRVMGGSVLTVAALIVCIQAKREGTHFVLMCFNNFLFPCTLLPGCGGGGAGYRRLSSHGSGAYCMHTSGTRGQQFFFYVFQQSYISMYISPGLRGGNRVVTGGSILTVAALIVCIQAGREEGGKFALTCFNDFISHVHFSRSAGGGPGYRRLYTHGCGSWYT